MAEKVKYGMEMVSLCSGKRKEGKERLKKSRNNFRRVEKKKE